MKNIIIKNIDLEALQGQKQSLLDAIDTYEWFATVESEGEDTDNVNKTHLNNLNSILILLDHISDSDIENRII